MDDARGAISRSIKCVVSSTPRSTRISLVIIVLAVIVVALVVFVIVDVLLKLFLWGADIAILTINLSCSIRVSAMRIEQ